jgi:UDP-glucuronate 4-epimerase
MRILITGTAGFIGFHLANRLLERGDEVLGLDNLNDYYDVGLKYARLAEAGIEREAVETSIHQTGRKAYVQSEKHPGYRFVKCNLEDRHGVSDIFKTNGFDAVVNLAAQAGVRYSLVNPHAYVQSNIVGFMNILEGCRHHGVGHLVYASSSSVYGLNESMPFTTSDNVDHPVSLYAASKKSNELMAHTYSHLYGLPTTGLRFFTVYGPWGRPDMALFLFTKAMLEGKPIQVFNHGEMIRDFTYVGDIVDGIVRVIDKIPAGNPAWDGKNPDPSTSIAPYKVYNIGNSNPVNLMDFIHAIEDELDIEAQKEMMPIQSGDVKATYADVEDLASDLGYQPDTPIRKGIGEFVRWYRSYYEVPALM